MLKNLTAVFVASFLMWLASTSLVSAQTKMPDYMRTFKPRATATPRVWFDPKPSTPPRRVFTPAATQVIVIGDPKPTGLNRACSVKIKNIQARSLKLITNASSMVAKFDSMTKRIEDYYMGTLVPQGRRLSNYSAMLEEIKKNKEAVGDNMVILRSDAAALNCNNLAEGVKKFNKDAQTLKRSLTSYKTSLEKFVRAVQSLAGRPGLATPRPGVTRAPGATCRPLPKCIAEGCKIGLDPNVDWCPFRPQPTVRSSSRPEGCVPPPSCIKEGCKIKLAPGVNWCPS